MLFGEAKKPRAGMHSVIVNTSRTKNQIMQELTSLECPSTVSACDTASWDELAAQPRQACFAKQRIQCSVLSISLHDERCPAWSRKL